MVHAKAVITDYIGTLVNARYYYMDASRKAPHQALTNARFETELADFLEVYTKLMKKPRGAIRAAKGSDKLSLGLRSTKQTRMHRKNRRPSN